MRTDRDHADVIAHEDEDGDVFLEIVWPSRRLLIQCTPAGWFYVAGSKIDGPVAEWNPRTADGKDIASLRDVIAELAAWQDAAEGPSENRIATTILDVAGMWWITIGGLRARVLDEDRFPWASWRYRVAYALLRAQWTGNGICVWLAQRVGGVAR